ncbi:MAG: hypothetical protein ACK5KO_01970 [Arachnia sp.]
MPATDSPHPLIVSYLQVRRAIGYLGLFLPWALVIWTLLNREPFLGSISDYYHSPMRDVFVGTMIALAVFLWSYRGYQRAPGQWLSDAWTARVASVSAALLAISPVDSSGGDAVGSSLTDDACTLVSCLIGAYPADRLHVAAATIFFVALTLFCLVLFPRAAADTPARQVRRRIYQACGLVMAACLILIAAWFLVEDTTLGGALARYSPVFWLEAVAIWAFAVSWMAKGKALDGMIRGLSRGSHPLQA